MAWGKSAPEGDRPSWLARIEANDAALRSVHVLRVRAFDEATQIATAKALEENEHVREFYASGHRVSAPAARAWAACLAINTSIKSMCVGDETFGDNGDDGTESALETTLRGAAHGAALERLDLEYKGVRDEHGRALGKCMAQCAMRELRLGRNEKLGAVGYAATFNGASEGATLETLDLTDNALDTASASALGEFLKSPCPLKRLGLTRCAIGAEGLRAVGAGLASRASVEALEMNGVKLGKGGAHACFGDGLFTIGTQKLSITAVEFVQCEIEDAKDVEALDSFLAACPNLVSANLRGNAFGDAGLATLAKGAFGTRVPESLDLGACAITVDAADSLGFVLKASKSLALFDNAGLGDAGVAKIFGAGQGSSLTLLDLGAVGLTVEGLRAVVKAFENPQTFSDLRTLVVGGNPGAQDDEWERLVNNLRAIRPELDVAWRAADGGDDSKLTRDATGRVISVDN